jgi:hypothetical protein
MDELIYLFILFIFDRIYEKIKELGIVHIQGVLLE